MTFCAISAATPYIRARCGSSTSWGSSTNFCGSRTPKSTVSCFDTDGTLRTFGNFSALKWLGFKQPYIALMPQWDFLDFLAEKASAYPEFTLIRNAEVTDVIVDGDRVVGVRTPELEVRCRARHRRRRTRIRGARRGRFAGRQPRTRR